MEQSDRNDRKNAQTDDLFSFTETHACGSVSSLWLKSSGGSTGTVEQTRLSDFPGRTSGLSTPIPARKPQPFQFFIIPTPVWLDPNKEFQKEAVAVDILDFAPGR